jgi:signal transduction histidine kinase
VKQFERLLEYWIRPDRSRLTRWGGAAMIALFGFLLVYIIHNATGQYVSSMTTLVAMLATLQGGAIAGLGATLLVNVLADYLYIPPIGSVFSNWASFEHLAFLLGASLAMNGLIAVLRSLYRGTQRALEQARQANHAMETVLAMVTHDVRNPLSAARALAQLIVQRKMEPSRQEELAGKAIDSLNRADAMIQSLLDFNRIRSGNRIGLRFESCDLRNELQKTVEELALVHKRRLDLDAPAPCPGMWSREGIRRLVENLVNNAVKYGDKSAPIRLKLLQLPADVELSVHNEGKALSAEEQETLFEPFKRTKSAEKGGEQGWGLGLTLVRGVAQAHGGDVSVRSRAGEGTTFVVRMPRRAA